MVPLNSKIFVHEEKLLNNIYAIKKRLNPGVQTMAVIKDNAYGHGLEGVAKCLSPHVSWFCVARVDEGVRLREIGIKHPILVFEIPNNRTAALYVQYDLTATLADVSSFDVLEPGTSFHVNLDTGMHRLGVLPEEVPVLLDKIDWHPELTCTGVYTHFAKADDPGNPEVEAQLRLFKSLRAKLPGDLMTHTANTGAIFYYSELDVQFDAVRPGVSLFGYGAGDVVIEDLSPALVWKSFLMQVKFIRKGEPVSYGGRWVAPEDGYIGTIPVGYAAGIHRILTNKIHFQIGGKLYPQVGTISMDYSMVFLGNDHLQVGEEVTLLNTESQNAKNWATHAGTIPYEITTGIHPLIPREYIP